MAWSQERIKRNIRKSHPWLTDEQVKQYVSLTDASKRRSFIKSLEYYRGKDGKS